MNQYKLITVYHPPEPGLHAHATFGYAGVVGALTGISAAGVSVHEANLEETPESFRGFPWILRLRHVMEHASTIAEAKAIWEAYFGADDPREAANASTGRPTVDALWRT